MIDDVPAAAIADGAGTPIYAYSLKRVLHNFHRLRAAFSPADVHIHYSAKANSSQAILRVLAAAGAGVDAVSGGEIHRALCAGFKPQDIVFAGVGKSPAEIRCALENGIGWFNVENLLELQHIASLAEALGIAEVPVALRLNPQVTANTHPYISTGHGAAKFGLSAAVTADILARANEFPRIALAGMHVHIGSQLGDAAASIAAIEKMRRLIEPYPQIKTINLGGGLPVRYRFDESAPSIEEFASALLPHLRGYRVLLEPGRAIVADAGILISEVQYVKRQAGEVFYVVDASMAELMRPPLYQAHHEIVPLAVKAGALQRGQVVGPVCETADVLARDRQLPPLQVGDRIALMTAGAYGMVMASNYNSRLRPAEAVVDVDGTGWRVSRRRETLADLLRNEL